MKAYVGLAVLTALTIPVAAGAADMKLKAPAPPPPPPFSWTGFYIGGEAGSFWTNGSVHDTLDGISIGSTNHDEWPALGGFVVGLNYQVSNIVFGVEGNFDWVSRNGARQVIIPTVGTFAVSANTDFITSVAGRLGVAFGDQWLIYAKGGGAWVRNVASVTDLTTGATVSGSNSNTGWLVGGGFEWAFFTNWSAKVEYDYIGLRDFSFNSVLFPGDTFTASRNLNIVKAGINYRFGWWNPPAPIMTRY